MTASFPGWKFRANSDLLNFLNTLFHPSLNEALVYFCSRLYVRRSWSCWDRTRSTTTSVRWPSSARTVSTKCWLQSRKPRRWRVSSTLIIQVCKRPTPNKSSFKAAFTFSCFSKMSAFHVDLSCSCFSKLSHDALRGADITHSPQMPLTTSWSDKHSERSCKGTRFISRFMTLSLIPGEHFLISRSGGVLPTFIVLENWSSVISHVQNLFTITQASSEQPLPIMCLNVITHKEEGTFLCVVPGKRSLLRCIQPTWCWLRGSSCSTLRKSEICSSWSCLLTQIQTHGSHVEVYRKCWLNTHKCTLV